MNKLTIEHKNLFGGKKTILKYPVRGAELGGQVTEILGLEVYKKAKIKDGVILDLGANIGLASLYFSQVAKQVYSFEPNPEIFETLKINTKNHKNIKIFNKAISIRGEKAFLYSNVQEDIPQTFYGTSEAANATLVECIRLDKFMKDIPHVDAMKIDIEGAEYELFSHPSFADIAKKVDLIVGESHVVKDWGMIELIPLMLKEYGFKTKFTKYGSGNYFKEIIFRHDPPKTYKIEYDTMFIATK